jgi:monofunctional chorismate mutase
MAIVTIRGAITVQQNTKEDILMQTKILLESLLKANSLHVEELIQIIFTATKDLTKAYPAVAAREIGITDAALVCMQEMYVEGSLERCVRVSVLIQKDGLEQKDAKHTYLEGAKVLRPDLVQE